MQRCIAAYERAQVSMRKWQLLDAQKDLQFCSSSECPEAMHPDCQTWQSDVESAIPSVVFRVVTSSGTVVDSAGVSVDGAELVTLDGRAVRLDPGKHTVIFVAKGLQTKTVIFNLPRGEKDWLELVELKPKPERIPVLLHDGSQDRATKSHLPRWTLPVALVSSATLFGAVGATYFGLVARAGERGLETCSPNCSHDQVDHVKREYLLANVSIGIASIGLVTAAVLVLLPSKSSSAMTSTQVALVASPKQFNLAFSENF